MRPAKAGTRRSRRTRVRSPCRVSEHARSPLPSVTHSVVLVEEVGGPGDGTDVCWLLITTLSIETVDDIRRVIDNYTARWTVEIF